MQGEPSLGRRASHIGKFASDQLHGDEDGSVVGVGLEQLWHATAVLHLLQDLRLGSEQGLLCLFFSEFDGGGGPLLRGWVSGFGLVGGFVYVGEGSLSDSAFQLPAIEEEKLFVHGAPGVVGRRHPS